MIAIGRGGRVDGGIVPGLTSPTIPAQKWATPALLLQVFALMQYIMMNRAPLQLQDASDISTSPAEIIAEDDYIVLRRNDDAGYFCL